MHLEISNRCNLACPYCYVGAKVGRELSTERWQRILNDLASYGVFQVTFGGGEPTLRDDLKLLALQARRIGLNLCMTTNGILLPQIGPDVLCLFNQVNVSYHGDKQALERALAHLKMHGVAGGVNFLALRRYMKQLWLIAQTSNGFGAELLLLTAKGVRGAPRSADVMAEARRLHNVGFKVAVDGLTCSGEISDFCMQKRRFCDVDSQGNVLPCSFVREPLGNLLETGFANIWRSRGEQVPCPFVPKERAANPVAERRWIP